MPHCHYSRKIGFIMAGCVVVLLCIVLFGTFGDTRNFQPLKSKTSKELQLVHLVFRHGARTPADTYPNDPYLNETFYPVGWGQITNNGKKELYETGKYLRKRYERFFQPYYTPDLVHAQATGVPRTQMSLAVVLASLWPPKNTPNEWNKNLNWQPIPISSEPLDKDTLLLVRTSCPRYYEALEEVFQLPEVKEKIDKNRPLMGKLSQRTGLDIKTPDDIQSLYSTLRAEEEFGLKLPEWIKEYYPHQLLELTELSYIYNIYNDELKRVKGGPFVRKMVNEWQMKRSNELKPSDRQLYIYTGHDSTVVNVLSVFNVWEQQIPGYGIMAMFELYKDTKTGEYGIELYLKNSTTKDPVPLTLPGCSFHCPLDKAIELVTPIISEDADCKAKDDSFTEPPIGGP